MAFPKPFPGPRTATVGARSSCGTAAAVRSPRRSDTGQTTGLHTSRRSWPRVAAEPGKSRREPDMTECHPSARRLGQPLGVVATRQRVTCTDRVPAGRGRRGSGYEMADRAVQFIPCGQPWRPALGRQRAQAGRRRAAGRVAGGGTTGARHRAHQPHGGPDRPPGRHTVGIGRADARAGRAGPAHGSLDTVSAPDHPRPVPGAGVSERGEGGREHAAGRPRYFSVQAALKAGIPSSGSSSSFSLRSVSGSSAVAEGVVVGRLRGTTETVASAASVSTSSNTLV